MTLSLLEAARLMETIDRLDKNDLLAVRKIIDERLVQQ